MKVRIDPDLCTGCAEVIAAEVPANLESAVQEAADDCPAEAILVE